LNTNGELKSNPRIISGGGVLRGYQGEWIKGFIEKFGKCTFVKAELRAVLRGLKMARDLGLKRIWLQADSTIVVGMLRGNRS